jgi:ABC-type sugar transport system permease subunit
MIFQNYVPATGAREWTLDNLRRLFNEFNNPQSVIVGALKNTLIFFSISLLIHQPLVILFSYFLFKKIWLHRYFRVVFFLPSIISTVVLVLLYKYILSVDGPIVDMLVHVFKMEYRPEIFGDSRYALWAIVIYGLWTGFGSGLIIYSGAFARIPPEVFDAAKIDGVGMAREIVNIIIPMIWPTISTMLIFAFVGIFNAGGPILLFTNGNYKTYTIGFWMFQQLLLKGNLEYTSAVGWFFTCISFPLGLFIRWLLNKTIPDTTY